MSKKREGYEKPIKARPPKRREMKTDQRPPRRRWLNGGQGSSD